MSDQNSFKDNPSSDSQAGDKSQPNASRANASKTGSSETATYRRRSSSDRDRSRGMSISEAGDRILDAARRNPEALVILAAGAAMLLRRGNVYGGSSSDDRNRGSRRQGRGADGDGERGGILDAAGAAGEYVTDAAGRIVDTAGEYVSTLSDYADDSRRTVTRGISRLSENASRFSNRAQASAERMLQGQPVAVAALGLATGAVVAAVLPRSEVERRTLVPAREALADAASRAVETVKETAERRFSADGLRDLAGDAAKIVTQTVLGKPGEGRDSDDRA